MILALSAAFSFSFIFLSIVFILFMLNGFRVQNGNKKATPKDGYKLTIQKSNPFE
ncbi:hypothetical protein C3B79_2632 [Aeromonas hydrophila]|nr:hypothetical protein C3B79_2632 [Aeromonas hydrophila]